MSDEVTHVMRLTIIKEIELQGSNYQYVSDGEGDAKELTKEEQDSLTTAQMIEYEKQNLEDGVIGLDDLLDDGEAPAEIKWEVVSG